MATVVPLGRCSTADGLSKIAKSLTESRLGMGRPACNYERSFIQLLECDDSRSGTGEMIGAVSTREGHASKSDLVDVGLDARASSYSLYCWFCNQNQEHGGRSRIRTLDRVLQAPEVKRFRWKTILCSGAFDEVSITNSGPSSGLSLTRSAAPPWGRWRELSVQEPGRRPQPPE